MTNNSLRTPSAPAASPTPAQRTVQASDLTEAQLRKMPESAYMNDAQLAFFRRRLLEMRQEVLAREVGARQRLNESESHADPADRATAEEERFVDMRLREREARLLSKIDEALARIRSGEYGWCTQTGEPIGIARLLARPTASVCVDMKERQERGAGRGG
jgi:DnaK suppressor protein